jgi:hypothetical protein
VEYFNYLGIVINDARYTCEVESSSALAKTAFSRKRTLFPSRFYLNL